MEKHFDRIYIEITNRCNFRCPFCSNAFRFIKEISPEDFEKILVEAKDFTNEVCLHVLGEPLMHSNFEEILEICKKHNMKINLVTNGFYLKEKLNTILKYKYNISKLSVSLHSYIYKPIIMQEKFDEIIEAVKMLSAIFIQVELRNLSNNNNADFNLCLNNSIEPFGYKIKDFKINQKLNNKLFYVVKKPFEWPDKTENCPATKGRKKKLYCMAGRTHIAVLSNLDVVPCCLDSGAKLKLGNLKETTIKEILEGEKFKSIYNSLASGTPNSPFCQTCTYNQSIKGN